MENPLPILLGREGRMPMKPDLDVTSELVQLYQACANGDPVNAKRLIKESQVDVKSQDYAGRTPLHLACGCKSAGAKELVQLLLDHGADANVLDGLGMTPMDIALKTRNSPIRKLLETRGVELQSALETKARESSWLLNPADFKLRRELGNTLKSVVHLADWHGTPVVVKFIKMRHREVMKTLTKSKSLALSLVELEGLEGEPMTPTKSDPDIEQACSDELLHEIELLSSLRHPDLVLFLGACLEPGKPTMFVSEFMPKGDVERYLYNMRHVKDVAHYSVPLWRLVAWCSAIARALAFLHHFPVVHRDLKPLNLGKNLLLTETLEVKVTDFGTSKILGANAHAPNAAMVKRANSTSTTMTLGVGTHNYMAPEVLRTDQYNEKVDIYALSLIMFYLSSGKRPFYHLGSNPSEILDRYIAGEEPRPDANECHKVLRPLMKQCWAVKAQDRPRAEDVLDSLQDLNTTTWGCGIGKLFA